MAKIEELLVIEKEQLEYLESFLSETQRKFYIPHTAKPLKQIVKDALDYGQQIESEYYSVTEYLSKDF